MSSRRHRMAALERRADYLKSILADWKGGDKGRARAESAALEWAIPILWDHIDAEDDNRGDERRVA